MEKIPRFNQRNDVSNSFGTFIEIKISFSRVTKAGRRMFPIVSVSIRGLEPEKMYTVELSFDQIDAHRWRYVSGQWQPGTKPDQPIGRPPYQHPDSPNYGETWMKDLVSFSKVKLTNKTNQTGPSQVRQRIE